MPVLRVKRTRDHRSAISGIPLDGRLFMQVRAASSDAEAVVGFWRVLLRKIAGKIVLIWDGSHLHRAHEIKDLLKRGATKRLHREQLPGSALDLNPEEGIWNDREAASNWARSVVPLGSTGLARSCGRKSASATTRRSSRVARATVGTCFSCFPRYQ